MSQTRDYRDLVAFIEARTRLTPTEETCRVLESALKEVGRTLLRRAHLLSLHAGNAVVSVRDLASAVRYELPTAVADAVECNVAAAARRVLEDPGPATSVMPGRR